MIAPLMNPLAQNDVETVDVDVAVIGAGPAGIAAAVHAAGRGLRIALLDRGLEPGGQIWRHMTGGKIPRSARQWLARLATSSARFMGCTSVVDIHPSGNGFDILASNSGRPLHVRASYVVLATGARELFVPFEGWTLPGVLGIGGAQALLKSGASFRDKRVVIAGTGPLMLPVAAALSDAGARLVLVAEQASRGSVTRFAAGLWRAPSMLVQAARYRARFASSAYSTGTWAVSAHGSDRVESVTMSNGRRSWRESADMLCTGYGLVPNIELARLLGCDVQDGSVVVDSRQRTTVDKVLAIGETTGVGGVALSLAEGEVAGVTVGSHSSPLPLVTRRCAALRSSAQSMSAAFAPRAELRALPRADTIVCRCEDVKYADVQNATCARQAKLYTRLGMGSCQGRTCMPGSEFLFGWAPDSVRPPVEPASVTVLSSELAADANSNLLSTSPVGEVTQ